MVNAALLPLSGQKRTDFEQNNIYLYCLVTAYPQAV